MTAKTPKRKAKTGRPKKDIDPAQVRQLAAINCSYEEIAGVVKCDPSTLTRRFSQAIKDGREEGKASLKRAQWKKAVVDGNPTMLIWLGKQYLGQRDESRAQVQHSGTMEHRHHDLEKLTDAQLGQLERILKSSAVAN